LSSREPKARTDAHGRDDARAADAPPASGDRLSGREILVCVCGGIAAYKTASLVSALVQRGAGVTVAMTANAQRFVGPVTFRALTGRPVFTSAWDDHGAGDIQHLVLAEKAELIIVAPATANILGKLAHGIADELVSALLLGAAAPLLMAPAMNVRMWSHPATQRNVEFLRETCGVQFVGPGAGWLACRDVGAGRMSEPEEILSAAIEMLAGNSKRL
jgi:phosphopantothenoylcysteine decarboxylase